MLIIIDKYQIMITIQITMYSVLFKRVKKKCTMGHGGDLLQWVTKSVFQYSKQTVQIVFGLIHTFCNWTISQCGIFLTQCKI